jgi:hypothetical protein
MKMCEFNLELVSQSHRSSMNEKFRCLEKICFELRKKVKVSENFKFSNLEKFSHLKNLDGMAKLANLELNPLSSQKLNARSHS